MNMLSYTEMEVSKVHVLCALLWVFLCAHVVSCGSEVSSAREVVGMTFLVTVNDTWYPEEYYNKTCLQTVKSPPLRPNRKWNESETIHVGDCDYGALTFSVLDQELTVGERGERESHTYIHLTFYSHVIEDASPPTCKILWDYKYREPTTDSPKESLLPGCFVEDSREGHSVTYYWFHILDWMTA